jgi:two-component system phosphate regulon response regulator PhoB
MPDNDDTMEIHGIVLQPAIGEAFVGGRSLLLTRREFSLLHFLAIHAGDVYTRQQIIVGVQGADYPATDRSVDSQVAGLRKKLGELGHFVEAVRGVGYRLKGRSR